MDADVAGAFTCCGEISFESGTERGVEIEGTNLSWVSYVLGVIVFGIT